MNQHVKYLGRWLFQSTVIVRRSIAYWTDCSTWTTKMVRVWPFMQSLQWKRLTKVMPIVTLWIEVSKQVATVLVARGRIAAAPANKTENIDRFSRFCKANARW